MSSINYRVNLYLIKKIQDDVTDATLLASVVYKRYTNEPTTSRCGIILDFTYPWLRNQQQQRAYPCEYVHLSGYVDREPANGYDDEYRDMLSGLADV